MKGPLYFGLVVVLRLEVLGSVLAVDRYVMVGGSLDLRPKASSEHFNNILWKHNGNLVVEWVENKVPVEFYSTFKGRSRLDTTNGRLEIDGMTKADSGFYSTEINYLVQSDRYDVKVIRAVPVPEVKEKRTLACNGVDFTDAEPITYSWKRDGQVIPDSSSPDLIITNDEETRRVKTYSCLMKNPVSEKESEAYDNPFFKEEQTHSGLIVRAFGKVVGQVIPDSSSSNLTITNEEETRRVKKYSCLMKNPVSEKESEAYDNPFFKEFSYLERLWNYHFD